MPRAAAPIPVLPPHGSSGAPGAARILHAAIAVFAQHGFGSGSVRAIAGRAQVDPALVVHAYGSKAGLWRACIDHVSARLVAVLGGPDGSPGGSLEAAFDRLLDAFVAEPVSAQFILAEIVRQDERFEYVFERLIDPVHDTLRAAIGKRALDSRDEIGLLAVSGAICMTVVSRGFMVSRGLLPADTEAFRAELKQAVEPMLAAARTRAG